MSKYTSYVEINMLFPRGQELLESGPEGPNPKGGAMFTFSCNLLTKGTSENPLSESRAPQSCVLALDQWCVCGAALTGLSQSDSFDKSNREAETRS